MNGGGDGAHIIQRQNYAGRRLDMGCEDQGGFLAADRLDHLVDGGRRIRRRFAVIGGARLQHGAGRGDVAGLKDLRPTKAEPAVAQDETVLSCRKLSRDRFHPVGPAPRHNDHSRGVVDLLQSVGDVAHDALEGLRHVVQRTVGKDHGIFEKAVGVDVRPDAWHMRYSKDPGIAG